MPVHPHRRLALCAAEVPGITALESAPVLRTLKAAGPVPAA
ncbi:hypothetical protein [Kitasatospora sp. NPDC017646]